MKKLFGLIVLMGGLFLANKASAGAPLDQLTQPHVSLLTSPSSTASPTAYAYTASGNWNTLLEGSTSTTAGASIVVTLPVVQSTFTTNAGVTISTFNARNCITDLLVELGGSSTFYMLDGGTTDYVVYGQTFSTSSAVSSASTFTKHWDHLGPWCGTSGNITTLSIQSPTTGNLLGSFSYDGYTVLTGGAAQYNTNQ